MKEVGSFNPKPYVREKLEVGETGYFTANIKSPKEVKMGDTVTDSRNPSGVLPGFKEIHPMVFSGIYPINTADYEHLKANMGKLQLNDSAFVYQAETSVALGFGFRCGFLGLLHLEIVQERLRREYGMDIIATYPSVIYRVTLTDGTVKEVDNPAFLPEATYIGKTRRADGEGVRHLSERKHRGHDGVDFGEARELRSHGDARCTARDVDELVPLSEILIDFHDRIKSMTRGYGSMDYEYADYQESGHGQAGHAGERRADGRVFLHRASHQGGGARARAGVEAQGSHPAPAISGEDSGGHRREDRRLRIRERVPQRCDREMLRRRRVPQAQAAGEAEGR